MRPRQLTPSPDPKSISLLACVFLVLLRLAIGWQFAYEGLWKLETQSGPNPWTAAGYLNNAQGPFRDEFRNLTGDPDDLSWLDYDSMSAKWDRWADRFTSHYQLTEDQKEDLIELLDGVPERTSRKMELGLPNKKDSDEKISFDKTTIEYDPKKQIMTFPGDRPPTPTDFARIEKQLPPEEERTEAQKEFQEELDRFKDLSVRLSYRQKLAGALKGDPNVTGVVFADRKLEMRSPDPNEAEQEGDLIKFGEKQVYLDMLADYEEKLKSADQDFEFDHLSTLWGKIQAKRNELVGPIKQLETQLESHARKLLTYEQIARGPVPPENTRIHRVNQLTIWALIVLGGCLMIGFCTRFAALAGAGMLMSFYLVWPPFPGVPEAIGPEHSLYINKNAIEALALMAMVFLPTSAWFGLDGLIWSLFGRKNR